ncbi:MAG: hypothetical protein GY747_05220 [Planctomycetes bacterium]|nr:hypothetical protein [Planctomycetota bacterium]MCP4771841.1 hypothetical protein [Planctomycetota bacterium]MCP4861984.1 hypothetical protein [Planctomycetota bacterium]
MNRPLLALLLLLAAFAGAAWFIMGSGPQTDDPPPQLSNPEEAQEEEFVAGLSASDISTLESGEGDGGLGGFTRSDLNPEAEGPLADPTFGEVRIQVVDAKYERPVHGATVWVLNNKLAEGESMMGTLALAKGVRPLLNEISERGTTNQSGIVALPFFGGDLKVAASYGDSFVFTTRKLHEEGPIVVQLRPALNVPVKVVNTDGDPVAEVPVSLRLAFGDDWRIDLLHTYTNEEGLAVLENVGLFKEEGELQEALFVGLPLPLVEPVEAQIPIPDDREGRLNHAWPEDAEPLLLTMPDTGPVEVQLLDVDGQPFLGEAPVFLYIKESLGEDPKQFEPMRNQVVHAAVTAKNGYAHFPWAQIGKTLVVESAFGGDIQPSLAKGPGPTAADKPAELVLRQRPGNAMVRGRLLLGEDRPLPAQRLQAVVRMDSAKRLNKREVTVVIDQDGNFNFSAPTLQGGDGVTCTLVFEVTHQGSMLMASANLPLPLSAGSFDCGDMMLEIPQLLVAGRIIYPNQDPVIGMNIQIEMQLMRGQDRRWRNDSTLRTATQLDGQFRIHGLVMDARYRLKMHPNGSLPVSEEFQPGTKDLQVILEPSGRLVGRVLVDEFMQTKDVRVIARFADTLAHSNEDSHTQDRRNVNRDGTFTLRRLPVAPVELEFQLRDGDQHILTLSGIAADQSGEIHRSLDPVDLRGLVHARKLYVTNRNGQPINRFTVRWMNGKKEAHAEGRKGEATIITTNGSLDARIFSVGYRTYDLFALQGNAEIVMEGPVKVGVEVKPLAPVPEGYRLGVLFRPKGGEFTWQRAQVELLNGNHRATMRLGEPGTYLATPFLQATNLKGAQRAWIEANGKWVEHRFKVKDKGGQQYSFELSGALMQDAVDRFESERK